METMRFESEVGEDGVLSFRVPLQAVDAKTRVIVTIEPAAERSPDTGKERPDWHAFIERTYGSCAALGLEEPPDLPLSAADWPS